jgi:hypothetical protein
VIRSQEWGNGRIDILSPTGKLLVQTRLKGRETILDLSALKAGMYLLVIQTGDERIKERIIKQ